MHAIPAASFRTSRPSAFATARRWNLAVAARTWLTLVLSLASAGAAVASAAAASAARAGRCVLVMSKLLERLAVEVRVEHANLGDLVNRQFVARGGPADRLGAGRVVEAERAPLVLAHVRADPGHALLGVALDDGEAQLGSAVGHGDVQPIGERALHDVARHVRLLSVDCRDATCGWAARHRERFLSQGRPVPILGASARGVTSRAHG